MMDVSDNVQSLTLTYLMNPVQYQRYMDSGAVSTVEKDKDKSRQFYRRRIVQATKDMSRGNFASEEMKRAYNVYADGLVKHFRTMDTHDIMQAGYSDVATNARVQTPMVPLTSKERDIQDATMLSSKPRRGGGSEAMERFIVREKTSTSPSPKFPSIKSIPLDDPVLRDKGVDVTHKKKKKKSKQ